MPRAGSTRRHIAMRLSVRLLRELDQHVRELRALDDRTCRTAVVEEAVRDWIRRREVARTGA